MDISIIAALFGPQHVIGYQGDQPLFLKGDLKQFRERTLGKPVIMGRKTYWAVRKAWEARYPGKEMLAERLKVVITGSSDRTPYLGSIVARNFNESLRLLKEGNLGQDGIFVIGGGQVYEAALPYANSLFLTRVPDYQGPGDVFFPDFVSHFPLETLTKVDSSVDEASGLKVEYQTYIRRAPSPLP